MFSFLKSEKLGTDCTREFSGWVLHFTEQVLVALVDDLGTDAADVRGVEEDKLLLNGSFLELLLLEEPSLNRLSLYVLSWP